MEFHQLAIQSLQKLTPDSIEITFKVPAELSAQFAFKAGQYVTLDMDGARRDYSLCSSPLDGEWSIGVKAVSDGFVSKFLNSEVKVGDFLKVSTPNGRFGIPSKPDEKRTILAFAAGSGITPILSVLRYTLQTEKWVNFYLFYANKTPETTMFHQEIEQLKQEFEGNFHPYLFYTQTKMDDWFFEGRLDAQKFKLIINQLVDINEVDEALVCGPNEMIEVITEEIFQAGIIKERIHFELFTPKEMEEEKVIEKTLKTVEVTVELDGEVTTVEWNTDLNLVDALNNQGIDAPYSCKGGICSTCLCRLEEGEVDLKENYILTDADLEDKLILACCTLPKSDKIRINFDEV
ncbi:MAG TPA: ferredoxin--NADP reductase [Moheibacter sp.]|nr:ferredoxin--NADP reductase [Moheibacter sp.]